MYPMMSMKTLSQGTAKKYILVLHPCCPSPSETIMSILLYSRVVESLNARMFLSLHGFKSCTRKPNFLKISKYFKLHAFLSSIKRPETTQLMTMVNIIENNVALKITFTFSWSQKPNINLSSSYSFVYTTYLVKFVTTVLSVVFY